MKLFRHGNCCWGHRSPFSLKRETRGRIRAKTVLWVDLQVRAGYRGLCDSQCAPKREGMFLKLWPCTQPLTRMFLFDPCVTPGDAKCLHSSLVQGNTFIFFLSQWNLCTHKVQLKTNSKRCAKAWVGDWNSRTDYLPEYNPSVVDLKVFGDLYICGELPSSHDSAFPKQNWLRGCATLTPPSLSTGESGRWASACVWPPPVPRPTFLSSPSLFGTLFWIYSTIQVFRFVLSELNS